MGGKDQENAPDICQRIFVQSGVGLLNNILSTSGVGAAVNGIQSPPPSLLSSLSPPPMPDGDGGGVGEEGEDGDQQQECGGGGGGRRKKPCLSARERNVRRIESNERERLRMHGLNEAFQVSCKQKIFVLYHFLRVRNVYDCGTKTF